MSKSRSTPATLAFCASMLMHGALGFVAIQTYIHEVELAWIELRKPIERPQYTPPPEALVLAGDEPKALAAAIPDAQDLPLPEPPEEEFLRLTAWGEAGGKGKALDSAPGEALLQAHKRDAEQAWLSRDPIGPGYPDEPSPITALPGDGGRPGRPGTPGPGGEGALLSRSSPSAAPFGVAPSPLVVPKLLTRPPVPVADVAPPPLPTPVEEKPVPKITQIGLGTPPPRVRDNDHPTTRPTDMLADRTQDHRAEGARPDPRGQATTQPATTVALDTDAVRNTTPLTPNPQARAATRPNDVMAENIAPPDQLPPEAKAKPLPSTRPSEGLPADAAIALAQRPPNSDAATPRDGDTRATKPSDEHGPAGQTAQFSRPAPAKVNESPGPGGDPQAGGGRPGAPREAADPAPQSDAESDPFSKSGGIVVRAGRVEASNGRDVKTIKPRIGLKGEVDAITSLQDPKVIVNARIDETGKVIEVKLLKSSGSNEIDTPTVLAIYKWWIEPPKDKDGKPRPDVIQITCRF